MNENDRVIYRLADVVGIGLASLTLLSVLLGWPLAAQYALLALLVSVPLATDRIATRRR